MLPFFQLCNRQGRTVGDPIATQPPRGSSCSLWEEARDDHTAATSPFRAVPQRLTTSHQQEPWGSSRIPGAGMKPRSSGATGHQFSRDGEGRCLPVALQTKHLTTLPFKGKLYELGTSCITNNQIPCCRWLSRAVPVPQSSGVWAFPGVTG